MEFEKAFYLSPLGLIEIIAHESFIISLKFVDKHNEKASFSNHSVIAPTIFQLDEYFNHKLKNFEVPVKTNGTQFQEKVWNTVQTIKYGQTASYLKIATLIGDSGSVRAVGAANGQNPILIIIPCHRIISGKRKLTGYSGGLWRKQWLLEHEAGILSF